MAVENEPPPTLVRHVVNFDTTLSQSIFTRFEPLIPRATLKLLEITGDGRLWFPVSLSLLFSPISLHSPTLYSFSLSLLLGLLSDILFIGILKHFVRRQRPQYNPLMGHTFSVDHWSFPSGHSSRVFFIASLFSLSMSALAQGIDHLRFRDRAIVDRWIGGRDSGEIVAVVCVFVWVWSVLTSASRVLLGRHFVLDVVVGASVGLFNGFFVHRFLSF
ncbi:putative lipid phosphate phosphatase beta [Bienertia sinuspersici]